MENAETLLSTVLAPLSFLPAWAEGVILLAIAAAIAVAAHSFVMRAVRRVLGARAPYISSLLTRTQGIARLALVVFAMALALGAAPFSAETSLRIGRLLGVAFIVLGGWAAVIAIGLATDFYLRRHRLDAEDNVLARKHHTQMRILRRIASTLVVVLTFAAILMTFEGVRQYGVSLLASAGAAGIVIGLAAQPTVSNLIAGIQLAVTQPIRIEDAVIVENEWGWVEEIGSTYVVIRLWDWRRLVVPLSYFIETPFQNWTRENPSIIGTVFIYVDYTAPIDLIRQKAEEIARASPLWDHQVIATQVTDVQEWTAQVRILASARNAPRSFDLRCEMREKLLAFLGAEHPEALPRRRAENTDGRAISELGRTEAQEADASPRRA